MDSIQSVNTANILKSASFLNVLPFIFLYILKNHEKIEEVKCESDKLFKYIPNKTNSIHPNMKFMLLSVPILLLLFKSKNNVAVEHTLVILSYAIAIKTAMHYMTPCLAKQEFTNIIAIVLLLNLRYFDIIQPEHTQIASIVSVLYSIFLILMRETTSANIISDYTISILAFLIPKYFG